MIARLAKIRSVAVRRVALRPRLPVYHNDNTACSGRQTPDRRTLLCYWFLNRAGRPECRWQSEPADGPMAGAPPMVGARRSSNKPADPERL
jgi:hypothetical protein